jgi:hypothetical protein
VAFVEGAGELQLSTMDAIGDKKAKRPCEGVSADWGCGAIVAAVFMLLLLTVISSGLGRSIILSN